MNDKKTEPSQEAIELLKKRGRKTKADLLYELKTIFFILNQYLNEDERIDKEADVDFYIWEMQKWLRENKYLQL